MLTWHQEVPHTSQLPTSCSWHTLLPASLPFLSNIPISGCMLGKIYSLKEQGCSGTAAQGEVGSPSLGVLQSHGDAALRDVGMVGWAGDLGGLSQSEQFYDPSASKPITVIQVLPDYTVWRSISPLCQSVPGIHIHLSISTS